MFHRRNRRQAGYSIFELMIVVAIMMILAAFAIINLRTSTYNTRSSSAAAAVVTQLRTARQMAISMRRNVSVTFTAPNQIQLAVQTLPNETVPTPPPAVFLNDADTAHASQVITSFYQFSGMPDTPMAFGNSSSSGLNFNLAQGGTSVTYLIFTSSGSLVGTNSNLNWNTLGNNAPVNVTIMLGIPGQPASAKAVTVLGSTGRVRTYSWVGPATGGTSANWQE